MVSSRVLCLVLPLICTSAAAQESPPQAPSIPPGEDKIEYLQLNDPAPYPGFLYDADTAVRWGNWLHFWKRTYVLDMSEQKKICAIREETKEKMHQVDLDARMLLIEEQRRQLEQARNPPWHQTVWFGAGVGAAGAFGVTLLAIWAVGEAAK